MFFVAGHVTLKLPLKGGWTLHMRQAVWPSTPKGGERMPITLTFHLFGLTFTLRIKK